MPNGKNKMFIIYVLLSNWSYLEFDMDESAAEPLKATAFTNTEGYTVQFECNAIGFNSF